MPVLNKISVDDVVYDIGGNNDYAVYGWDGKSSSQTAGNLELFQKILDDHLAGKNILIVRNVVVSNIWKPELYIFDSAVTPVVSGSNSSYTLRNYPDMVKGINSGYTEIQADFRTIVITTTAADPTVVTGVTTSTSRTSWAVLEVNRNYSTPFTPTSDGHPATKKYVDDHDYNITSGTTDPSGGSDGDIYLKYEA